MNDDRVYPSANPAASGGRVAPATANGEANKAQLYNGNRPSYRPQPPPKRGHRHRRGCCCSCCLWTTLAIFLLLFLAAVAGAVFYVLYRPHRPSFAVNSLRLSKFNLTDTSLASSFNFSITARNPNKKITFFYDTISVKFLSGDLDIADGSFPGFTHGKKNTTTFKSVVSSSRNQFPDGTDIAALKSILKNRNLHLMIQLETEVKLKIGKFKTKKLKIRVSCDGIKISIPTGKMATSAATSKVKCKVDPRIKILKWTI